MECYETCADRGKRCVLAREKLSCGKCGKIRPCYNIQSIPCGLCPPTEPCNCHKQEKAKWQPRSDQTCRCTQTCWEWILSFLGFGADMPECCRNMQLTAWQSGEVARQALVSKVQSVVSLVSGKEQSEISAFSPKVDPRKDFEKTDKKITEYSPRTDTEPISKEMSDTSPEQTSGKEAINQPANEKKGKAHKSRSRSSHRKGKYRKGGSSKSRSVSREKREERKLLGKMRSPSTSSTSVSQGRKHRSKSRSESRASVKIYNPFKTKQSTFKCTSPGTVKPTYSPKTGSPCPPLPPRCFLGRISDNQVPYFSHRHASPSCQNMQTTGGNDRQTQIRRSHSTSYKPYQASPMNMVETSYQCPPVSLRSKPPSLSRSFHSTPPLCLSIPSKNPPLSSDCTPTTTLRAAAPTLGQRALSCLCYTDYSKKCSSCQRACPCAMKSRSAQPRCCKNSCTNLKPTCSCSCASRHSVGACHSYCTKSCCLALSPPQGSVKRPYVCSAGAGCCCPTHPVTPTARSSCFTNTCKTGYPSSLSAGFGQSNQDSVICQKLLSKYGYSPPMFPHCPMPCYGNTSEDICSSLSCTPLLFRCPNISGCSACRASSCQNNLLRVCEFSRNLTNSRKPRSPEGQCRKQIIEFKSSPCERKPKYEFQLPPHCIRETGPRSPVGEYLALLRVPKPVRRTSGQEETNSDKLMEPNAKAPETAVPESGAKAPGAIDQKQESSAKAPDESSDILEANVKPKVESSNAKPAKKKSIKQTRKSLRRSSENHNASASNNWRNENKGASNNWRNENKGASNQYHMYIAKKDSPRSELMFMAQAVTADFFCSPEMEGSYNNNYGGDSYRFARYSSAGPVLTDFCELSSHRSRYPDVLAQSSASSGYLPRYSGPIYNSGSMNFDTPGISNYTTQNFDTRGITNYTTPNFSREARQLMETGQFGSNWYTARASSNANINAHRQYTDIGHTTAYNRSLNSHMVEISDSLRSSRYRVQLDAAIQSKIKELRQSRVFSSPPARKRLVEKLHLEPRTRFGMDRFQSTDSFIRESWDTLNKRAEKRRKDMMFSKQCVNIGSTAKSFLTCGLAKQPPHQVNECHNNRFVKHEARTTRGHQKHNSKMAKENKTHTESKPPREATKQKYEIVNKTETQNWKMENAYIFKDDKSNPQFTEYKNSSFYTENKYASVLKEYTNKDAPKEKKTPTRNVALVETTKMSEEKPVSKIDCMPVLQDIIESFEETVELLIQSHKMDGSAGVVQPQEGGVLVAAETKDKVRVDNNVQPADSMQPKEENLSSNKLDKNLASQRQLAAVSSPPQKPLLIKSQEDHVSGDRAQTCSCRSNSQATTSSISLEMSHSIHSAASSPSVSESEDTSLTFSKLSQASRTDQQTTQEDCTKYQASASTVLSIHLSENTHFPEGTRASSQSLQKIGPENAAMTQSQICLCGAVKAEGSSVDPSNTTLNDNGSKLIDFPSDKEHCEFENTPIVQVGGHRYQSLTPEGGDTMFQSDMEADDYVTSICQNSSGPHILLDELMRQFIRQNGTPV